MPQVVVAQSTMVGVDACFGGGHFFTIAVPIGYQDPQLMRADCDAESNTTADLMVVAKASVDTLDYDQETGMLFGLSESGSGQRQLKSVDPNSGQAAVVTTLATLNMEWGSVATVDTVARRHLSLLCAGKSVAHYHLLHANRGNSNLLPIVRAPAFLSPSLFLNW